METKTEDKVKNETKSENEETKLVMENKSEDNKTLDFQVTKRPQKGTTFYYYEARTPYRDICWIGTSEENAIGHMLKGMSELARRGSWNPHFPNRKGVTPVQHALCILEESLQNHLEMRRQQIMDENCRDVPFGLEKSKGNTNDVEFPTSVAFNRLNEIISGLATTIAALARVKEL